MNPNERLLDLVAFLLAARRPVTASALFHAFEDAYAGTPEARERKFNRDKEELRELGIQVVFVPPGDDDDGGYRIDRAAFYLPDIHFTPEERAALFAVGAAAQATALPLRGERALALAKLRTVVGGEEHATPAVYATDRGDPAIADLMARAVAERRQLKLRYPPETAVRVVDPYAFSVRRGRFSLVAFCRLRGDVRTFHADRTASCVWANTPGKAGEYEIPADFDPAPHLPTHPWQVRRHAPVEVTLTFSPELAESGPRALGLEPGAPCPTVNLDGLIAELLALGPGAGIAGPVEAKERLQTKLAAIVAAHAEAT